MVCVSSPRIYGSIVFLGATLGATPHGTVPHRAGDIMRYVLGRHLGLAADRAPGAR